MKNSSATLNTARLGWLIGAFISILLNGNFGYTLASSTFTDAQYAQYIIWGACIVFGLLDIFKNRLGAMFSRLLAVDKKLKATAAIVMYVVIYVGFVGVSGASTNTFFSDKAKAQQLNSPAHIAKLEEIEGLEITYNADKRTYDNIVKRNDDRRKLDKAPLETEETTKKNAMDASRSKLATAKDEFNNLPAGSQSWFAKNGESFGMYFTFGLELFIFFCSYCIALIKEDDAAQDGTKEAHSEEEAVQSETYQTSNTALVSPIDGTETAQNEEDAKQLDTVIDTRTAISRDDLAAMIKAEIVPMSARAISEKYQISVSSAQRLIKSIRATNKPVSDKTETSNLIILPTTTTKRAH